MLISINVMAIAKVWFPEGRVGNRPKFEIFLTFSNFLRSYKSFVDSLGNSCTKFVMLNINFRFTFTFTLRLHESDL